MDKPARSTHADHPVQYPAGQRLHCAKCGSEIEIISPCTCNPSDQVLKCCGESMKPSVGRTINLGVE